MLMTDLQEGKVLLLCLKHYWSGNSSLWEHQLVCGHLSTKFAFCLLKFDMAGKTDSIESLTSE